MYKCCICHANFTERDSLCENWNDPNKRFGCPYCKNFLQTEISLFKSWSLKKKVKYIYKEIKYRLIWLMIMIFLYYSLLWVTRNILISVVFTFSVTSIMIFIISSKSKRTLKTYKISD